MARKKDKSLGALSRVCAPRPKRPSATTAALSLFDYCRIGHPAAIDNEAVPAEPVHASRIGDEAADSRHLPVPDFPLPRGAAWLRRMPAFARKPSLQGEGWVGMVLRVPLTCAKALALDEHHPPPGLPLEGGGEKRPACSLEIPPPNHHTCAITFFSARLP